MPDVYDAHHEALMEEVTEYLHGLGFTESFDCTIGETAKGSEFKRSLSLHANLVRTRTDRVFYDPYTDRTLKVDAKTCGNPQGDTFFIEAVPYVAGLVESMAFGMPYLFACRRRDGSGEYGVWANREDAGMARKLLTFGWKTGGFTRGYAETIADVYPRELKEVRCRGVGGSGDPCLAFEVDVEPTPHWKETLNLFARKDSSHGRARTTDVAAGLSRESL